MNKKTTKQEKKIPYQYKPEDMTYDEWQIALRRQYAQNQNYIFKNVGDHDMYTDFELTNHETNKTYKVAIRSKNIGINFCSCPDFVINSLGTCKHIEYIFHKLQKRKNYKKLSESIPELEYSSLCIKYGENRKVVLRIGTYKKDEFQGLAKKYFDENNILKEELFNKFEDILSMALKIDSNFHCYKDVIDYVISVNDKRKRNEHIDFLFPEGINAPELDHLLKTKLYPYQKDAIIKIIKAGRAILADDMGLGKTVQSLGVAELMKKELGINKVLIICPTSLKYQWKKEIEKFTNSSAFVIEGLSTDRKNQYSGNEFYKIITYNVVTNDLDQINTLSPDLIIIDEAQRIKNWKTKTAQQIKTLKSQYALVLTGTPIENKLEELHSITEFVDRYKLGPLFRFLAKHQILESNKVIGYKKLHEIKNTLSDILIRRTKDQVLKQLPERIDKICYVPVTKEQKDIHEEHYTNVCKLVNKWRKYKYLSEKERQMLMIHLNCMRMVSNSTYILDQKTRFDTKIDELMTILKEHLDDKKGKVVIFSQWERMTRIVAIELEKYKISYQHLHGGVASSKRKDLLTNFHEDPNCTVFLSTDTGGVGLNLQCANMVVNLDCPWNPAVLEQRIARVYRMGQKESVNIINFISEGTIEETLLSTLKFKKSVFDGVLDNGMDEVFVGESKFKQFIKTVENIVVDKDSINTQDDNQQTSIRTEEGILQHNEKNNDLLASGINFLEKLGNSLSNNTSRENLISKFIEKDEKTGNQCIKIPITDKELVSKAINALGAFLDILKNK